MSADFILIGKIFTSQEAMPYAEAFAVEDGKIIAVGKKEDVLSLKSEKTIIKSCENGLVTAGFTEGHAHVSSVVELTMGPFLGVNSIEKCQQRIKEFAQAHPGKTPIFGGGFDPGLFGTDGPTADLIDEVVSDRAVIISDEGHHSVWVNSKAMEIAGITRNTSDPECGKINHYPNGEPSGFLQEMAIDLITPAMPNIGVEEYKQAILYYQNIGLENGIVSTFEPMLSHSGDEAIRFDAYDTLEKEGKLKITYRVAPTLNPGDDTEIFFQNAVALHKRFADRKKIQVNTIKFFMDGVVDGHTALLREPYCVAPFDCGPVMYEQEELNKRMTKALKEGFQIHVHAIGDAAIDEALNAFEAAQTAVPGNYRNAITHLQVCQPDHPKRMKKLGVVAVVNPYWFYETPLYQPLELPFLGKERAEQMYYVKAFAQEGIVISQASDFPVTVPPDTMMGLHIMVNRMHPKESKTPFFEIEALDIESALKAFTLGGAYENFLEDKKGSIEVGKDADFVILSQDVTTIPKEDIYKTKVMETWIAGQCCFKRRDDE